MSGAALCIAGRLARGGRLVEGWVEVRRERVAAVGFGRPPRGSERHAGVVGHGLVDLQLNGAGGVEVTGGPAALDAIDRVQLEHGVTSYLATLISTFEGEAAAAVAELAERAADPSSPLAGVHLEGPFLAPEQRGVHRRECLALPSQGEPAYYRSPAVRLVTVAPELPGALELVAQLVRRGVAVSLGHSGASAADAARAAACGARSVTHLFNAMKPFHHRSPNLAGWALAEPRVRVGLIADGFHVDRLALRLVARLARRRVVLVSDASPAAGAGDGRFRMAGVEIEAEGGRVQDTRGELAGSSLTLDEAVRRYSALAGVPLAEALQAASERPARLVGLPGGLRAGAPANLVLLDERGRVERVMRRGAWLG